MEAKDSFGICVPVAKSTVEEMQRCARQALAVGDSVEYRLDDLKGLSIDELRSAARRLSEESNGRAVITLRPQSEGGSSALSVAERKRFWEQLDVEALCDLEAELLSDPEWEGKKRLNLRRVICSYHNFDFTPDLLSLYQRYRELGAFCYKFAAAANKIDDVLIMRELIRSVRADGRRVIGVSMGMRGVITRIFGLSWGNVLTFASLDSSSRTAPGQITAKELRHIYRTRQISSPTEVYGIVANPAGHSASPIIHNTVFAESGRDAVYVPIEADNFGSFLDSFVREETRKLDWNIRGLSVTIPHKGSAYENADRADELSRRACAANTLLVEGRSIAAWNTDVSGLLELIPRSDSKLRSASVLGAGGAARAAIVALVQLGYRVSAFARDPARSSAAAQLGEAAILPWAERTNVPCDVLINATPVGMAGDEASLGLPDALISDARLIAEMVYRPLRTQLIEQASRLGVRCIDGLSILIAQACKQQELWTGCRPNPARLRLVCEETLREAA